MIQNMTEEERHEMEVKIEAKRQQAIQRARMRERGAKMADVVYSESWIAANKKRQEVLDAQHPDLMKCLAKATRDLDAKADWVENIYDCIIAIGSCEGEHANMTLSDGDHVAGMETVKTDDRDAPETLRLAEEEVAIVKTDDQDAFETLRLGEGQAPFQSDETNVDHMASMEIVETDDQDALETLRLAEEQVALQADDKENCDLENSAEGELQTLDNSGKRAHNIPPLRYIPVINNHGTQTGRVFPLFPISFFYLIKTQNKGEVR